MAEKMWTPEKAAKLLNITPRTVKNYLNEGTIQGVKVARKWLIPDSDLQAYIDGLKAKRDAREYAKDHVKDDEVEVEHKPEVKQETDYLAESFKKLEI